MTQTVISNYKKRLAEIAETSFGTLSDDQVLQFLAERKQLEDLRLEQEQKEEEAEKERQAKKERAQIEKELARLNALISPDKDDDELLELIGERKVWEAKMEALGMTLPVAETKEPLPEKPSMDTPAPVTPAESPKEVSESEPAPLVDEEFGNNAIAEVSLKPGSELAKAFDRIKNEPHAVGKILDDLPASAKQDKIFMLAVATIDPAYAMHYADKDVLKKDADFNLRVIATKGQQSSGSVLAEMLPEARTAAVVMAAVKRDYRNVRFALPQMEGYDMMLEKAKKSALEKVKAMKESVDVALLIPKILQKDKAFMKQVEELASQ